MRRAILTAAATALLGGALLGGAGGASAGFLTCGPIGGRTVAADGGARVYTVNRLDITRRRPYRVSLVLGCVNPNGPPRLLGSPTSSFYRNRWLGLVQTETLDVNAPWVAYARLDISIDTSVLTVATVNLRTNARAFCPVGGTMAPQPGPSVARIALADDGRVAWAGEGKTGDTIIGSSVPRVVACDSTGSPTVLDEGEGIDLDSLSLHGSTLSWTHSGEPRYATLG